MTTANYLCYNGEFYQEDEFLFSSDNRAFLYGDSIFETIRSRGTQLYYINEHLRRLRNAMDVLSYDVPRNLEESIKNKIALLIHKNKLFKSNRIRISIFRNSGGLYTPTNNSLSYLIQIWEIDDNSYKLNKKGLNIGVYSDFRSEYTPISQFKTGNSSQYTMAGLYAKQNRLDEVALLSNDGYISETISSNIFVIKNGVLQTPSIKHGGIDGIIKDQIIQMAAKKGMVCYEDADLRISDLENADEIFITNSIQGIKWVVAFGSRRYFNKITKKLSEELNNTNHTD
ncbi:MAG: aminotransferase class IV [Marinifilaceae bacterium]|jgi:branched-chain amino acid aminotransferase|nr:aminotransferase class IV [Marinifilaceae bacterium]